MLGEHDKSLPDAGNPDRVYHSVQNIFKHEEYIGFENNYDKDVGKCPFSENRYLCVKIIMFWRYVILQMCMLVLCHESIKEINAEI